MRKNMERDGSVMKIPIIISNSSLKVVNSEELDELLRKNAVLAFHRSDGWVKVGFDDIRDPNSARKSSWKDRKALRRKRVVGADLNNEALRRICSKVELIW